MSRLTVVQFEPTKMGLAWKGNKVQRVVEGSQAAKGGVKAGWTALLLNTRRLPTKGVGDKLRSVVQRGKRFSVTFRMRAPRAAAAAPGGKSTASRVVTTAAAAVMAIVTTASAAAAVVVIVTTAAESARGA